MVVHRLGGVGDLDADDACVLLRAEPCTARFQCGEVAVGKVDVRAVAAVGCKGTVADDAYLCARLFVCLGNISKRTSCTPKAHAVRSSMPRLLLLLTLNRMSQHRRL